MASLFFLLKRQTNYKTLKRKLTVKEKSRKSNMGVITNMGEFTEFDIPTVYHIILYLVSHTLETVPLLSERSSLKCDFMPSKCIFYF